MTIHGNAKVRAARLSRCYEEFPDLPEDRRIQKLGLLPRRLYRPISARVVRPVFPAISVKDGECRLCGAITVSLARQDIRRKFFWCAAAGTMAVDGNLPPRGAAKQFINGNSKTLAEYVPKRAIHRA